MKIAGIIREAGTAFPLLYSNTDGGPAPAPTVDPMLTIPQSCVG